MHLAAMPLDFCRPKRISIGFPFFAKSTSSDRFSNVLNCMRVPISAFPIDFLRRMVKENSECCFSGANIELFIGGCDCGAHLE